MAVASTDVSSGILEPCSFDKTHGVDAFARSVVVKVQVGTEDAHAGADGVLVERGACRRAKNVTVRLARSPSISGKFHRGAFASSTTKGSRSTSFPKLVRATVHRCVTRIMSRGVGARKNFGRYATLIAFIM